MSNDLDLSRLSHTETDNLILTLSVRLDAALRLISELQARIDDLTRPGKTPDNSGVPPSKGGKSNRPDRVARPRLRAGRIGRQGGGRTLTATPNQTVIARAVRCQYWKTALADADQKLDARYDKIELPEVAPMVTRVERYAGHCQCCGHTTLGPVLDGLR